MSADDQKSPLTSTTALVPFNFHGDQLEVISTSDGAFWVVLARLCEPFELQDHPQAEKLKNLSWATTRIIRVVAQDGKVREVFCLNLRSVAGWLFTLNVGKVAPHLREKLVRYQRECADALAEHFQGRRVSREELNLLHGRIAEHSAALAETQETLRQTCEVVTRDHAILTEVHAPKTRKPAIGRGKAKMLILDNLIEVAKLRAAAFGIAPGKDYERAYKHFVKIADDRLRVALNFPRAKGCDWPSLPVWQLGDATIAVGLLVAEARDDLGIATGTRHRQQWLDIDLGEVPRRSRKNRAAPPPAEPDEPGGEIH